MPQVGFHKIPDLHKILAIIKGSSAQGERKDLACVPPSFTEHPRLSSPIRFISVRMHSSIRWRIGDGGQLKELLTEPFTGFPFSLPTQFSINHCPNNFNRILIEKDQPDLAYKFSIKPCSKFFNQSLNLIFQPDSVQIFLTTLCLKKINRTMLKNFQSTPQPLIEIRSQINQTLVENLQTRSGS